MDDGALLDALRLAALHAVHALELERELVDQLLSKGAFNDAFVIWKASHESEAGRELVQPSIYDGGFEGALEIAGGGFTWRVPRDLQDATIALDSVQPHSGAR